MNKFKIIVPQGARPHKGIHELYQDIAKYIKNNKNCDRVLKTDADNEGGLAHDQPIVDIFHPNNIDCIEIDKGVINKAKESYPDYDFVLGNIQKMPFEDERYDVVLDFSTIDHQKDYKKTLDEYRRVLKPGGLLSVVVWTARGDTVAYCDRPEHERQYYFSWDTFTSELEKRFSILQDEKIYAIGEGAKRPIRQCTLPLPRILKWYLCKL
jgi:SAM-dependent methyltransferase